MGTVTFHFWRLAVPLALAASPASAATPGPSVASLRARAELESGLLVHRKDAPRWEATVVEQRFWQGHVVFRIDCHCGADAPVPPVTVVVSRGGEEASWLANGDGVADRSEVSRFNEVARAERVAITGTEAADYLGFFLSLHQRGPVVTTRAEAQRLATSRGETRGTTPPWAAPVRPNAVLLPGPRYAATVYAWDAVERRLSEIQLVSDARGRMRSVATPWPP
jgi:hypothetical protein